MAYEHRPGQGSLFKNKDALGNPRAPNLKGSALIQNCDQFYELDLAAWTKKSDRAGKWLSLSVKLKQQRKPAPGRAAFNERVQ
jgi:hypothetical protein